MRKNNFLTRRAQAPRIARHSVILFFLVLEALPRLSSCSREAPAPEPFEKRGGPEGVVFQNPSRDAENITPILEGIAEIERSGGYYPGLAFTESGIREKAGDYAGAVIAAYKELSRSYGLGGVGIDGIREALERTLALFEEGKSFESGQREEALSAVRGVIAFSSGEWEDAENLLRPHLREEEEPDSFLAWMLLVCSLENKSRDAYPASRGAYGAIRARYGSFPEYWFRGARFYSGESSVSDLTFSSSPVRVNISGIYAEECINLSPSGPFAKECRLIIAESFGLREGGEAIRSKVEIEETARRSVSGDSPELLGELFPLIALPDNSYTNYAVEILKNLSSVPGFRDYFEKESAVAQGRLAERLRYISRG